MPSEKQPWHVEAGEWLDNDKAGVYSVPPIVKDLLRAALAERSELLAARIPLEQVHVAQVALRYQAERDAALARVAELERAIIERQTTIELASHWADIGAQAERAAVVRMLEAMKADIPEAMDCPMPLMQDATNLGMRGAINEALRRLESGAHIEAPSPTAGERDV